MWRRQCGEKHRRFQRLAHDLSSALGEPAPQARRDRLALVRREVPIDGAPQTVKAGVSKDEAAQIKAKLEEQGATVEVK